jgi:AcrR family transcriptional regulator
LVTHNAGDWIFEIEGLLTSELSTSAPAPIIPQVPDVAEAHPPNHLQVAEKPTEVQLKLSNLADATPVAAAADIAVGTIYRYYASRAELCAAIVSVVSQRELDVLSAIAAAEGSPAQKIRDAVKTFVARAMRGRRLAYGLIFEPIDPEVESTRLKYRRAIARVFGGIIRQGIAVGEFRDQDVDIAGACVVGAFMEGLIGCLAPDTGGVETRADEIAREIANLCLAAVAHPDSPVLRMSLPNSDSTGPIPIKQNPKGVQP